MLLLVAQGVLSIGLWHAGAPIADEGVHILRAYAVNSNPKTWTSLFYDVYALLLWAIDDPVSAHLVYRAILAPASVLVLWRILRSFGLSWNAATLASAFWIGFGLANPLVQGSNINLFCFSLAGYGLSLVLEKTSGLRIAACATTWFLAAGTRPEYALPLALFGVVVVWRALATASRYRKVGILLAVAALCAGLARLIKLQFLDSYLMLGLGQCYARLYARMHPEARLEVFTEYRSLIDSVFEHPRTFVEAIANNPVEFVHYLWVNSTRNLPNLLPGLASNVRGMGASPRAPVTLASLAATVCLLAVGTWFAYRRAGGWRIDWRRLGLLTMFASGSLVGILLLIPLPRYWIECAPLVYAWLGIALEAVVLAIPRRIRGAILFAGAVGLLWPMPWERGNNRQVINVVGQRLAGIADPVVGAFFPHPWVAFALRGYGKGVYLLLDADDPDISNERGTLRRNGRDSYLLEHSSTEECLRRSCDLVIITDEVRTSRAWKVHQAEFALLQPQARVFELAYSSIDGLDVYVRRRS